MHPRSLAFASVLLIACDDAPPPRDAPPGVVGYAQLWQTFLRPTCTAGACHTGSGIAGLSFDDMDASFAELVGVEPSNGPAASAGYLRVASGDPEKSLLYMKLRGTTKQLDTYGFGAPMPFGGIGAAGPKTLEAIRGWIAAGAPMQGDTFERDYSQIEDDVYVDCDATDEAGMRACFPPLEPNRVRFYTPSFVVPAASDYTLCVPLAERAADDYAFSDLIGREFAGGHHVVLMESVIPVADLTPHECGDADMSNVRLSAAPLRGGLAEGIAMHVHKGAQLVIQTHYVNPLPHPVTVMSAAELVLVPDRDAVEVTDPFVMMDSGFEVPPGAVGYERQHICTFDDPLTLHVMFGHAHAKSTLFTMEYLPVDGPAETIYRATDGRLLRDNPEVKLFGDGLDVQPGDQLRMTCRWDNATDAPITWPEEMCVSLLFYTPSVGSLRCDKGLGETHPVLYENGSDIGVGCVTPGAQGNALGVGEYCTLEGSECVDNPNAVACLVGFDARSNFCSIGFCAGDDECGEGAVCRTSSLGSACVPIACLGDGEVP